MTELYDPNFDFKTGAECYETHWTDWVLAGGEPIRDLYVDAWLATVPAELM
jgi:hypothetical protein